MFGRKDKNELLYKAFYEEAVPHLDPLYATALRLTKNENDAEDLVQETMLKAFRYFEKYEKGTNCKAWSPMNSAIFSTPTCALICVC